MLKRIKISKKFLTKLKSKNISYLIIVLLGIILVSIWFRRGFLIAYGEYGDVLIAPDRWLQSVRYIWNNTYGTGVPANFVRNNFIMTPFFIVVSILSKVFSMISIQKILFGTLLISGALFMYLLASRLTLKDSQKPLVGLLAALFYMLNPYAMLGIWNRFVYPQMFMYASLPLMLLLYVEGLERKRTHYILFLASASVIFYLTYSHPAYVITQWFVLLLYFLFFLYVNRSDKSKILYAIRFSASYGALWFLFHAWWILPFVKVAQSIWNVNTPTENLNNLIGLSRYLNLYYISRLLQSTEIFVARGWGNIYYSIPFQIISWLIPLIVLLGAISGFRNQFVKYLVGLSIVGLFFAKGVNPPWGSFLLNLFKLFPILGIFRDTFGKIGIIIPLGYAFLFGTGLTSVFLLLKRRSKVASFTLLLTLVVAILVVYPWPMWTGKVFGGAAKSVFVRIPEYYADADKWISKEKKDFRILHLPLVHIDWAVYDWPNGYHGFIFDHVLFGKPAITGYQWTPFVDSLYRQISKVIYTNQLWKIMAIFNARYVVVHNDVNYKVSMTDSPDSVKKALSYIHKPELTKGTELMKRENFGRPVDWSLLDIEEANLGWDLSDMVEGNVSLKFEGYPVEKKIGIVYQIPTRRQDLSDKAFLAIWIKINVPAKLFLGIGDWPKSIAWDGRQDPDYSYGTYESEIGEWKLLVLPFNKPTNKSENPFDFQKDRVRQFFISSGNLDPTKKIVLKIGGISAIPERVVPNEEVLYVKTFGKLDIFKIEEKYFLQHIYATNQFEFSKSPLTLFQDIEKTSFIPGEKIIFVESQLKAEDLLMLRKLEKQHLYKPKIVFRKINPAKYTIKIENASQPFFLIFSETYNPEWKAYINGKTIDSHYTVNGYANAYFVSKKGTYDITLEYMPNRLLNLGGKISIVAIGLLASGLFFITLLTYNRQHVCQPGEA